MCHKCKNTGSVTEDLGSGIYRVIPCHCKSEYEHAKDPEWISFKERLAEARERIGKQSKSQDRELLLTS